ncbi:MAG: hypothetical protein IJP80_07735, partial [Bacteroidales bacterium]|nr:hypothetical protein [Bacteroidales bacterium]
SPSAATPGADMNTIHSGSTTYIQHCNQLRLAVVLCFGTWAPSPAATIATTSIVSFQMFFVKDIRHHPQKPAQYNSNDYPE